MKKSIVALIVVISCVITAIVAYSLRTTSTATASRQPAPSSAPAPAPTIKNLPLFTDIEYGQEYKECKKILDEIFSEGKTENEPSSNRLLYEYVRFAGEDFDIATFSFKQGKGGKKYLCGAMFAKTFEFDEYDFALDVKESLIKLYAKVLHSEEYTSGEENEIGEKNIFLGKHPKKANSHLIRIVLKEFDGRLMLILHYIDVDLD